MLADDSSIDKSSASIDEHESVDGEDGEDLDDEDGEKDGGHGQGHGKPDHAGGPRSHDESDD